MNSRKVSYIKRERKKEKKKPVLLHAASALSAQPVGRDNPAMKLIEPFGDLKE